jgi:hypothetical protein
MTDLAHNQIRPEPLPPGCTARQKRIDGLLAESAAYELSTSAPPVDLAQRVFEASVSELGKAAKREELSHPVVSGWRLPPRQLAAAAAAVLLLTTAALLLLVPASQRQGGAVAIEKGLPERLLEEGLLPLVEGLESDYDQRIARAELTIEHLAAADVWSDPPFWGRLESELIVQVEGW